MPVEQDLPNKDTVQEPGGVSTNIVDGYINYDLRQVLENGGKIQIEIPLLGKSFVVQDETDSL